MSESGPAVSTWMRRARIRQEIGERGFVSIEELARAHGVSQMTIHRDLSDLEANGYLRKVRGGATTQPTTTFHGDLKHRMDSEQRAKEALARAAAAMIGPNEVVLLDDSTTCLRLAALLPQLAPLTVITNFLPALTALGGQAGVELIGLGGTFSDAHQSFVGPTAAAMVDRYRGDILFMSTTAVTDGKCFHHSPDTVLVKQALMAVAARRVLLIDHTKFDRRGAHYLAEAAAFDEVLVDDGVAGQHVDQLRRAGAKVTLVSVG